MCLNVRLLAYFYVFLNYIHRTSARDGWAVPDNGSTVWTAGSGHFGGGGGRGIRRADVLRPTPSINVRELNTRVFIHAVYRKLNPFRETYRISLRFASYSSAIDIVLEMWKHEVLRRADMVFTVSRVYKNKSCWAPELEFWSGKNPLRVGRKVALISGIIT